MLDYILESSGLTAKQVARCFNIVPRTLQSWQTFGIPARYEALVHNMYAVITGLSVDTPEERRRLLLDSSQGKSLYRQLCDQSPQNQQVQYQLTAREQLGLGDEV